MIWLPTLELLLRITVILLILTTIVHVIWSIGIVANYLEYAEQYTKADYRWLKRTACLIAALLVIILTQKFFQDNNIPIDMFFRDKCSQSYCHACKS